MWIRRFAAPSALCIVAMASAPVSMAQTDRGALPEIVRNPVALAAGKRTYSVHCSRCHGLTGMGSRSTAGGGPNLRDAEWIHGSSCGEMVAVTWNGVPGTLMKSWRRDLGAERIQEVVAYIFTFRLDTAY